MGVGIERRQPVSASCVPAFGLGPLFHMFSGYKVIRIPWSNSTPAASADSRVGYETVIGASDVSQCPDGCIRPVGLAFDRLGRLFVSSDTTGEIFIVEN
jgi:hypothetical protein